MSPCIEESCLFVGEVATQTDAQEEAVTCRERDTCSWPPQNPAGVFASLCIAVTLAGCCASLSKMFDDSRTREAITTDKHVLKSLHYQACPIREACQCIESIPAFHRAPCAREIAPPPPSSTTPACLENVVPGALGWEGSILDATGALECTFLKPPERRELEREAQTSGFCGLRSHQSIFKDTCDNYDEVVTKSLRHLLRPGDIVILSNYDSFVAGKFSNNASLEVMVTRIGEFYNVVHSQGANLVLVGSPPHIGCPDTENYLLKCSPGQHGSMPCRMCDVNVAASELAHKPLKDAYTRLASELDGTMFFDIHELLCDNVTCGAMIPGTRVMGHRDSHHLTRAASIYLAQFLCSALGKAGWMPK